MGMLRTCRIHGCGTLTLGEFCAAHDAVPARAWPRGRPFRLDGGFPRSADERFDLLEQLVLDLEVPRRLRDATTRCSSHLPIPIRTAKSFGLPETRIDSARPAAITPLSSTG
jgi:hypothetical protein